MIQKTMILHRMKLKKIVLFSIAAIALYGPIFIAFFKSDVRDMYRSLRSGTVFNYDTINNKMIAHQSVWPEAIWNEDEYNKYIDTYVSTGKDYLFMLQGDKKAQRDWWLYNAFKYRDSKYYTGDAATNVITLRCYSSGGITVTPYQHLHPRIQYGSAMALAKTDSGRVKRNTPVLLENPITDAEINDLETYIYSADRIASVGDLSPLKVGMADFSAATKLQDIIVGSETEGYNNPNLYSLTVGNNELLTLVNVTNCTSEKFTSLDVSNCHGLEVVKAKGTKLTGITFPNGGHLTTLEVAGHNYKLNYSKSKKYQLFNIRKSSQFSNFAAREPQNL